ncbi:MAG: 6-carboxytetrahydropterin synthase QueD, partial [Acidobacteriota bacterium]|nr:6-carboxytetrahydropterin synthase QueD [Acidobacteriota bacterium]
EYSFSAGHALRNYKGKCENVHGHNYRVRVTVEGDRLNGAGLLMDFADLKSDLRALADRFDHQYLNDMEPFDEVNPSAENLARYLGDGLAPRIGGRGVRLQAVTVWETDRSSATYKP